jgi:hypothetical protein
MPAESDNSNAKPAWVSPIELRKERAGYYFEIVLNGQSKWYSDKARQQKSQHLLFAIVVIVLGVLISVMQVFAHLPWVSGATALLGVGVTLLRAIDILLRPGETWQAYRKVSENMKQEYRLYLNNADVFAEASDEETAYRLLIERTETIIAEEQQLFWQFHAKSAAPQETPKAPEGGE